MFWLTVFCVLCSTVPWVIALGCARGKLRSPETEDRIAWIGGAVRGIALDINVLDSVPDSQLVLMHRAN